MPDVAIAMPDGIELTDNDKYLLDAFIKKALAFKQRKQFISFIGYCIAEANGWLATSA